MAGADAERGARVAVERAVQSRRRRLVEQTAGHGGRGRRGRRQRRRRRVDRPDTTCAVIALRRRERLVSETGVKTSVMARVVGGGGGERRCPRGRGRGGRRLGAQVRLHQLNDVAFGG